MGEKLEVAVPLLRLLMTAYTVHHAALGERLQRLQILEGVRAPSPSHTRAARQLVAGAAQHHRFIVTLHSNAAALRSALRQRRANSAALTSSAEGMPPFKNTIEPILGAGLSVGASTGAEGSPSKGAGVGVLVWRIKAALRGLAEVYETLSACWEDVLREETTWAERVADAETFGPVCASCVSLYVCVGVCMCVCVRM